MQYAIENNLQLTNRMLEYKSGVPCVADISLDFDEVAESHVVLFSRLLHYLRGESECTEGEFTEHLQQCELGRWLMDEGAECFGKLQAFCHLRDIHEQFHREAETVLAHLHAGSWVAAEQACKQELSLSLRRVLVAITAMNAAVHWQDAATLN